MSSANRTQRIALRRRRTERLMGVVFTVVVVGVAVLAYRFYVGDLTPSVPVTLEASRTGLLLEPGARVSLRGVSVGRVKSVESVDGKARIQLAIDPDDVGRLPANVTASLKPNTLFGAKFVDIGMPADPTPARLERGSVIRTAEVSPEADQVFENALGLLRVVQPQKINATLSALSGALAGRGDQLGQTVEQLDTYLAGLQPSLDPLGRDLKLATLVVPTYRVAAPDLIASMDNFRTTSRTLVSQQQQLSQLLTRSRVAAGETTALMIDSGRPLTGAVRNLRAPTTTLDRYAPMLTCLMDGFNFMYNRDVKPKQPGVRGAIGFLPRARPYQYPQDLPKVNADSVGCRGLPVIPDNVKVPHYNFDTGRSPFIRQTVTIPNDPAGGSR